MGSAPGKRARTIREHVFGAEHSLQEGHGVCGDCELAENDVTAILRDIMTAMKLLVPVHRANQPQPQRQVVLYLDSSLWRDGERERLLGQHLEREHLHQVVLGAILIVAGPKAATFNNLFEERLPLEHFDVLD